MTVDVLCVDDSDRPDEIPLEKWINKDQVYTVIRIVNIIPIPGVLSTPTVGFELLEITLDETNYPYLYFNSDRFRFKQEDLDKMIALSKVSVADNFISDINVNKLELTTQ